MFYARFAIRAVILLALGSVSLTGEPLRQFELRFEPEVELTESFLDSSIPGSFKKGEEPLVLVSISASEAPVPRSSNPNRTLAAVDPADFTKRLDADRLLLSEIRKIMPESRGEAENYLDRLKMLAGKSDPLRLVPLADRLLDQAPIYFDWLDREFANQDEQVMEYYVGGARGFSFAFENFKTAVLFTIMNRLDVASRVISEAIVN